MGGIQDLTVCLAWEIRRVENSLGILSLSVSVANCLSSCQHRSQHCISVSVWQWKLIAPVHRFTPQDSGGGETCLAFLPFFPWPTMHYPSLRALHSLGWRMNIHFRMKWKTWRKILRAVIQQWKEKHAKKPCTVSSATWENSRTSFVRGRTGFKRSEWSLWWSCVGRALPISGFTAQRTPATDWHFKPKLGCRRGRIWVSCPSHRSMKKYYLATLTWSEYGTVEGSVSPNDQTTKE